MSEAAITRYLDWVKDNGGAYTNIMLKNGCVYSTDTIRENESFATMPFKICISDAVARQALPGLDNFPGRVVLSLYLTIQKLIGEESFYYPYISILPKEIKTTLYFDEQDLQYIKNTNIEAATKSRKQDLQEEFNQLLNHLPADIDKENILWDDYLYCYSVVSSRSFPFRLVDPSAKEDSEALFPLLDSLNHKPNTKITWSTNNESVSFVAGQEFKVGEEVFNNYGPKSNEELLLGYGFCFEHNDYDYITLKPNFSQDPNYEVKQQILKDCKIASTNESDPLAFYIHRNNIPDNFFRMMRVLVMNALEVQCYLNCSDSVLLDFIGYRNELSMISMVLMLLKNKLHALRSVTLEEENITESQRYALMYRRGQEEIYNVTVEKMDEIKNKLIKKMYKEQVAHRIAPQAPFLNINNRSFFAHSEPEDDSMEDDSNPTFLSLDMVVITLKQILNQSKAFADIIAENFEDLDEEMDMVMTLALMKESVDPKSKWKDFFVRVSQSENMRQFTENNVEELQEMYESIVPAFAEAYPEVFNLKEFSFQSFKLADHILNFYSIDSPLVVVPL